MNSASFCPDCGTPFEGQHQFCGDCGASRPAVQAPSDAGPTTPRAPRPAAPPTSAAPPGSPASPTHIGRFVVGRVLGRGGFGTVYLAHDPASGQAPYAIKVLDRFTGSEDRDAARVRLHREAAAMAAVDSPFCVRVVEVVDAPDLLALVTDFIDGVSLRAFLDERGRLTGPQALVVLDGALRGLDAVHRGGLVHADLKPDNIMLATDGRSRLIDFGLVGPPRPADPSGWVPTGSPGYLSPEHLSGGAVDARSDLYAFGVMLHELLTGRRPFTGSVEEVLRSHVETPARDPRLLLPDLGDRLAELCLRAMAKDPAERPQSAAEALLALERAASERYGPDWRALGALGGMAAIVGGAAGMAGGAAGGTVAVTGSSGAATTGTALAGGGLATKIGVAAVVVGLAGGGGYAATQVLGDDGPGSSASASAPRDVYAYVTDETDLVVMAGSTELTRVQRASSPSWSDDGRYVVALSATTEQSYDGSSFSFPGRRLTIVDTRDGSTTERECDRCAAAAVWGDLLVTSEEQGVVEYTLSEPDEQVGEIGAPPGTRWTTLLPAGDTLVALGHDENEVGYRGGPMNVGHLIADDDVTELDGDAVASLWGGQQAYTPASADGGPQVALRDSGSGGACVNPVDVNVLDPSRPSRSTDTDTSPLDAADPDDYQQQESWTVTDLWYDGDGVLHLSGDSMLCVSDDDFNSYSRPGTPQQVWRLDGDRWVADDERALLSEHVLPTGSRLELARVTTQSGDYSGMLTMTDDEGTTEVADHVVSTSVPPVPSGEPVAERPEPEVVDLTDPEGGGVAIDGTGDTSGLTGVPQDFVDFIGRTASDLYSSAAAGGYADPPCDVTANWVSVDQYDPRGFATGGIGICGGAAALWAKQDGEWVEVQAQPGRVGLRDPARLRLPGLADRRRRVPRVLLRRVRSHRGLLPPRPALGGRAAVVRRRGRR